MKSSQCHLQIFHFVKNYHDTIDIEKEAMYIAGFAKWRS